MAIVGLLSRVVSTREDVASLLGPDLSLVFFRLALERDFWPEVRVSGLEVVVASDFNVEYGFRGFLGFKSCRDSRVSRTVTDGGSSSVRLAVSRIIRSAMYWVTS